MITTSTFNFTPNEFEQERIKIAAKGNWDAAIDLCMQNILYDEERSMWVKCPEPDFDRRRSGGNDMEARYVAYLQHNTRLAGYKPQDLGYPSWYDAFCQTILSHPWQEWLHGHLDPYGFVMELFDARFSPDDAVEIFGYPAKDVEFTLSIECREGGEIWGRVIS